MDAKEFRSLLLLLREDLEEKDIPHRTTMTTRILELHEEQTKYMSRQMLVSLFILLLVSITLINLRKPPWEKFLLPWMFGPTLT
jgi:hypothetical protein